MITCQLGGSGSVCGGLLLLALSQLCFALSRSLPCLLATRFVGGFAGGVIWAAVLALCHVLSLRRGERAGAAAACERESLAGHVHTSHHARGGGGDGMGALYGTVLSSVSYGTTIGAPLGGALYSAGGWALPLGCTVVLCVLSAAALALLLPHEGALTPTADEDKSGLSRSSWLGLASWRLASVLCLVLCGAMLFSSVDAVLPAQLRRRYGQTSLQTSLVFFVMSVRAPRGSFEKLRAGPRGLAACAARSRPCASAAAVAHARAQVFYGLSAPAFGVLADRSGKALHVSMAGLLGLALLLPVFALPLPHWALIPVAMLFGTSATAQLTPASSLLTSVASAEVRRSPPLAYAMFNTAYTLGLALGPAALGALTELFSFQQASACLSGCALALAGCSALFIASLDTRGEEHQMLRTASQPHTPGPSPRPGPIDARTEEEAEGDEATSAREGLLSSAAVDEQQHEHPR